MSNDATREAWDEIIKELDYFEAKPHKLNGHNRKDFEDLIAEYGNACRLEMIERFSDKDSATHKDGVKSCQ